MGYQLINLINLSPKFQFSPSVNVSPSFYSSEPDQTSNSDY